MQPLEKSASILGILVKGATICASRESLRQTRKGTSNICRRDQNVGQDGELDGTFDGLGFDDQSKLWLCRYFLKWTDTDLSSTGIGLRPNLEGMNAVKELDGVDIGDKDSKLALHFQHDHTKICSVWEPHAIRADGFRTRWENQSEKPGWEVKEKQVISTGCWEWVVRHTNLD